jgi:polar amino acid transport system substrate-binding protein
VRRAAPRAAALLALGLLLPATARAGTGGGELRWGADPQGGAPNVFADPADPNRLVGFEVEVAERLAARLGLAPRLVPGPWAGLLELLRRGDVDVALNGVEVTEEKRRVVALSRPYFAAAEVLTVRRGTPSPPRTVAALQGVVVGTLPGSLAQAIAAGAGAVVRTYEGGQNELYEDLALGRLDAVLLEAPIAHYYGDVDPRLEAVEGDFGEVRYAVAVRLEEPERLAAVDAALEALRADGSLREVYLRWGVWGPRTAALLGDLRPAPDGPAPEYERWRQAVGRLPPLWERLTSRYPAYLPLFARGAALTLAASVAAMALAVLLGLGLAVARRARAWPLRVAARAYVELFRGTPLLVQLTMLYFGLPELGVRLDPFLAGVVALGLNYAAAEAENDRAGLNSVPRGQLEAAQVLGLSPWQTLRFVVGPQAVRTILPVMTNDFLALLKDSSLVSLVTLTELTKTYGNLASATRDHLGLGLVVAAAYLLLGFPFAVLARALEARWSRHLVRGAPP